jgi:N6-adenosine-specific RNA methylase IME4
MSPDDDGGAVGYDDQQAAAQLLTCALCGQAYYMTHPRAHCLRCRRRRDYVEPFTTILADPPWRYGDALRMSKTKRSSQDQYRTMTVEEIGALYTPSRVEQEPRLVLSGDRNSPREQLRQTKIPGRLCAHYEIADDAFLWLWTTNAMLLDGSAATVCNAWGFTPKQVITWIKMNKEFVVQLGMGRYTRGATEHLVLATRGKAASKVVSHSETNVIFAPRLAHSAKPDVVYALIEAVSPGPYLELFARERRAGWTSHGDELPVLELQVPVPEGVKRFADPSVVVPAFSPSMILTQLTPTGPEGTYERIYPDTAVEWPE